MKNEVFIHQRLFHPGIVQFEGTLEYEDKFVVFMELCSLGSLQNILDRRYRLTEPEVQYFMLQVLDSIEYLHSEQIIHRDIKPDNIFLQDGLRVKIGDFGFSKYLPNAADRST